MADLDIGSILETARKRQEARAALFATLPCAGCELDTAAAKTCKRLGEEGEPGCKHAPEIARRQTREKLRQVRAGRLARAGVPDAEMDERLRKVVRGDMDERDAVGAVRKALAKPELRWLVLSGQPGAGKTLAAFHAIAEHKATALYILAPALARPRPLDPSGGWTIESASKVPLLVIDDLGEPSTYALTQLEELICGREYGPKLTLITTNLESPSKISSLYGARVASRLGGERGAFVTCRDGDGRARLKVPSTRRDALSGSARPPELAPGAKEAP